MFTYLKCIWWNKVMLISYISIILTYFYSNNYWLSFSIIELSLIMIGLCKFGFHTIDTYKRNLFLLKNNRSKEVYFHYYYDRTGLRWAKFEYENSKNKSNFLLCLTKIW